MGNSHITLNDYHTNTGYFRIRYNDLQSKEPYRMLIVPLTDCDGNPFFYVREDDDNMYEVIGEGYYYQEKWNIAMQSYRNEVSDAVTRVAIAGKLGYYFLNSTGGVIKEEWQKFSKSKNPWFVTDSDSFQCCRVLQPTLSTQTGGKGKGYRFDGEYELIQLNACGPAGTSDADRFRIANGVIRLVEYTEAQILSYLKFFGYENLLAFLQPGKDEQFHLLAEMIFETEAHSFELPEDYDSFVAAGNEVMRITGLEANKFILNGEDIRNVKN